MDCWRDLRDAGTEALFFSIYANLFSIYLADKQEKAPAAAIDPQDLPDVRLALSSIRLGGYVDALARIAFLLTRKDEPLPLSRLELRRELAESYADYLPDIDPHEWRTFRGRQEIIVRSEPEQALQTLPDLLAVPADRRRMLALLDKLARDPQVLGARPTVAQKKIFERIRSLLAAPARKTAARRPAASRPKTRSTRRTAAA
jgi:hypothetical protein